MKSYSCSFPIIIIKITAYNKQLIIDHIESFPAIESHYCRQRTDKKYISGENIRKMFSLFIEKCNNNKINILVTERQYRDNFNINFNIYLFIL